MDETAVRFAPEPQAPQAPEPRPGAPSMYETDYLVTRCSICFDRQCDFCLVKCRDQFCRECFSQYVGTLVANGWGLQHVEVKCPVCSDPVSQDEWRRWTSATVAHAYDAFSNPYRSLQRFCECSNEPLHPAQGAPLAHPQDLVEIEATGRRIQSLIPETVAALQRHIARFTAPAGPYPTPPDSALELGTTLQRRFAQSFEVFASHPYMVTATALYQQVACELEPLAKQAAAASFPSEASDASLGRALRLLRQLASQLIRLEHRPRAWLDAQFDYCRAFPAAWCNACAQTVCLQCGARPYHAQATCLQALEAAAAAPRVPLETAQTLRWKLRHSKPCPRCAVLIQRDDGCNKLDCTFCGLSFCWRCQGRFERGACSYYQCVSGQSGPLEESSSPASPESGVPNVDEVHRALARRFTPAGASASGESSAADSKPLERPASPTDSFSTASSLTSAAAGSLSPRAAAAAVHGHSAPPAPPPPPVFSAAAFSPGIHAVIDADRMERGLL